MTDSDDIDFSTRPYEEWVRYLFGHDEEDQGNGLADFPDKPIVLVRHLARLCQNLPDLVKQYNWAQINQGLWAALSFPFFIPSKYFCQDQIGDSLQWVEQCRDGTVM